MRMTLAQTMYTDYTYTSPTLDPPVWYLLALGLLLAGAVTANHALADKRPQNLWARVLIAFYTVALSIASIFGATANNGGATIAIVYVPVALLAAVIAIRTAQQIADEHDARKAAADADKRSARRGPASIPDLGRTPHDNALTKTPFVRPAAPRQANPGRPQSVAPADPVPAAADGDSGKVTEIASEPAGESDESGEEN